MSMLHKTTQKSARTSLINLCMLSYPRIVQSLREISIFNDEAPPKIIFKLPLLRLHNVSGSTCQLARLSP